MRENVAVRCGVARYITGIASCLPPPLNRGKEKSQRCRWEAVTVSGQRQAKAFIKECLHKFTTDLLRHGRTATRIPIGVFTGQCRLNRTGRESNMSFCLQQTPMWLWSVGKTEVLTFRVTNPSVNIYTSEPPIK